MPIYCLIVRAVFDRPFGLATIFGGTNRQATGGHLYLTGTSYLRTLDNDSFDKLIGDGNITIMGEGSELQCGGGIIGDGTFTIGSGANRQQFIVESQFAAEADGN
jgi:20S proteasome alpha/beta subunit